MGLGRPGAGGKRRKKGADPDSEEERWLDALEEGKLEQVRCRAESHHIHRGCGVDAITNNPYSDSDPKNLTPTLTWKFDFLF